METTIYSEYNKDDQVIFKASNQYNAISYGTITNIYFENKFRAFEYDIMIHNSEFERVYRENDKNPNLLRVEHVGPSYIVRHVPEHYIITKINKEL